MVSFTAGATLTAASLNSAFNALTIRTVTSTSDTLVLADNGGGVSYSNSSATTSTIPPNSSVAFATGTTIQLLNLGAGVVTVTAGVGVTVNGASLTLAQNAGGTLIKTATNTWYFLPSASALVSSTATVATSQTTTSGTYTDLATAGPAVTVTTGTKALVVLTAQISNDAALGLASMGFAVSGATTLAAAQTTALSGRANADFITQASAVYLVTGLTAGSNTFTAKYQRLSLGTSTFSNRVITVIDMGS